MSRVGQIISGQCQLCLLAATQGIIDEAARSNSIRDLAKCVADDTWHVVRVAVHGGDTFYVSINDIPKCT